jgi:beta-lactamase regulating signal transducer with metallopeptidase domain
MKRLDPGVRLIAFLLLSVYWFHPCVWVFYRMLCRDMELACDEMVLKQIGMDKKKLYSQTLLECSVLSKKVAVCPLAFGETSVKERIKNILHFHRPKAV